MRRLMIPVIALSIAAVPAVLEAQQPRGQRGERPAHAGAIGMRGPAAMNPAARVLEHREALGLSLDQVRRLQQIEEQVRQRNEPLLQQLQAARPAGAGIDRAQMRQRMEQRRGQVTPEQRAQLRQRMEQRREQVTPEQREQARQQMEQRRQERLAQLTPEQRAQMEARRQEMQARMEQFRNATPEQRAQLREQARAEMAERRAQVTPEQRAQMRQQMEQRREQRIEGLPAERRAQVEALRPVMEQLRASHEQARADVQAVLTAEQQATLRELGAKRAGEVREQMRGRRGPGGFGPAGFGPGRGPGRGSATR